MCALLGLMLLCNLPQRIGVLLLLVAVVKRRNAFFAPGVKAPAVKATVKAVKEAPDKHWSPNMHEAHQGFKCMQQRGFSAAALGICQVDATSAIPGHANHL